VATVGPDSVLSVFEYDAVGNRTLERIHGTPLTGTLDPSIRPTPSDDDDYRELRHEFDANNRRIQTETRAETLYSIALADRTGDGYYTDSVVTLAKYDANGNPVEITDGNGGITRSFYDAVGDKVLEVDPAGYVTYRHYNGQGQVILETQFAGQLTQAFRDALTPASSAAAVLAALSASGEDRSTAFAYDALGRKVEESRLGVTYTVIDPASGRPTFVTADVVTSFKYDGNGNVIEQTLADGGRINYTYDALNRISARLDPQFQAFIGQGQPLATLRSQQLFKYDAHGNEAQHISLGATPAENREVLQRFDSAGNLRERTEPGGAGFTYDYDLSGNTLRTTHAVRDVHGTLHQYRTYATFDAVDREISRQDIADQGTAAQVSRETQDTQYNGYGDVVAKGVNGQYQETQRYDCLGRLFATREKGVTTLFIYDANGNAVLKIKGIASDVTRVMEGGVMRAVRGPADAQAFSPEHEQFTTSFYDERNLLVAVAEAPMTFGSLLAAQPVLEGSRRDAPEALRAARDSLPTALSLRNATNATLAVDRSREFNASADVPVKGFGAPSTSNTSTALDARNSSPPNFGVPAAGPPVLTEPVVTLVSDTENSDHTVRTVVEDITRTITTTTVEAKDLNGDGVFETVVKTLKTENPVTRRTTIFTRSRNESVDQDGESLSGEATVTLEEATKTTGTVNVYEERTTRTILGSTVTEYTYPGAATGVLNLLPAVPLTINIDYNRSGLNIDPELDEIVEVVVSVNSPAIAGLGNDPVIVEVYGPAGQLRRQTSTTGGAAFAAIFPGTYGDAVSISVTKGGSLLYYNSYAATDETVNLGPFVSLKELPPSAVGARLLLLSEDGSVAATLSNFSTVTSGSTRELVFSESPAGAFYSNRRYEYTLLDSQGGIVNRVQGRLGSTARSPEVTTRRNSFTREVTRNTLNQNGSFDQSASSTPDPKQANYLLNLVRSITQGVEHESIIKREQTYNAFKEVVTQADGRGFLTELFYDKQGNLARQVQPETTLYPEVGAAFRGRPVTQYLFNQLSEQVGTQDANSAAFSAAAPYYSTRVLVNGRVAQEFDAHGNLTQHFHDLHGQERLERDALNQETAYSYDPAGQLLRQERFNASGTLHSADSFQYDVAGNRIGRTNALGDTETYLYDDQGRITEYRSFAGLTTTYTYAYQAGIGGVGGYEKVTTSAGISGADTQIERTDLFGNLRYSKDLGGHEFTYEYDAAGLLRRQSDSTVAPGRNVQDIRYEYYLNGLIRSINDLGVSSYSNFAYDENGNRTEEIYSKVAIIAGLQDVHPYQVAHATYDELNRQSKIADAGRFEVEYGYDANGNRRFVASDYFDLLTNNNQHQEFYYKYDKLGQFTVTLGQRDAAGQIVSGTTGYAIEYDALGRRISATSRLLDKSTQQQKYAREEYQYDRIGTVNRVEVRNESGALLARSDRRNSAVGSLLEQTETKIEQGVETETRKVEYTYDRDQRVRTEITTAERNLERRDRSEYTYDGDGILTSTFATTINRDGNVVDSADRVTTTYLYEKWNSYKQSSVNVVVGDRNMRNWRTGTSTYSYDSNGHTKSLYDAQAARTIEYVNNQSGQVLKRYQIDREPNGSDAPAVVRNFYYLNGRGIGDTGNDRVESRVDYAQQLAEQEKRDKRGRTSPLNPQLSQRILPVTSSDYDANYQPLNDGFPAKVAGTHIVQPNETLQSIALSIYGDSSLWYLIADANGLTGNDQLVSGLRLTTPNVIANTHNRADTYRPYDVEAALGNTKPTLSPPPPPQGKKGCGGVGTVLVFAVAIIAGTLTAGAAAPAIAGLFSSGFTAGVAGAVAAGVGYSLASQAVFLAAGFQNKLSFKQVGKDTISELVSFGLNKLAKLAESKKSLEFLKKLKNYSEFAYDGLRGAVASGLTQGISVAAGLQRSFDWREVGIAGGVSALGGLFRREVVGFTGLTGRRADLVGNIAAGIGGSLVRKAAGEEVNSQTLLQDIGGVIGQFGNGLVRDALSDTVEVETLSAEDRARAEAELLDEFSANKAAAADEISRKVNRIRFDLGAEADFARTARVAQREGLNVLAHSGQAALAKAIARLSVPDVTYDDGLLLEFSPEVVQRGLSALAGQRSEAQLRAFLDAYPGTRGTTLRENLATLAQIADDYNFGTRLLGGVQLLGGIGEATIAASLIVGGTATSATGVGIGVAVGGYGLFGLGVDQASAGLYKIVTGEYQPTFIERTAVEVLDATPQQAAIIDVTVNFLAPVKGIAIIQKATAIDPYGAAGAATVRVSYADPLEAGYSAGQAGSLPRIDAYAIDQRPVEAFTRQLTMNSCGAACGVEVLSDIGVGVSQTAVAYRGALNLGTEGITDSNLLKALNELAGRPAFKGGVIDAADLPNLPTRQLRELVKSGTLAPGQGLTVLLQSNRRFITVLDPLTPTSHFVVVNGLDAKGLVRIQDPRGLTYGLTQKNFVRLASDPSGAAAVIFQR
jgi:YD repeat-containing protein